MPVVFLLVNNGAGSDLIGITNSTLADEWRHGHDTIDGVITCPVWRHFRNFRSRNTCFSKSDELESSPVFIGSKKQNAKYVRKSGRFRDEQICHHQSFSVELFMGSAEYQMRWQVCSILVRLQRRFFFLIDPSPHVRMNMFFVIEKGRREIFHIWPTASETRSLRGVQVVQLTEVTCAGFSGGRRLGASILAYSNMPRRSSPLRRNALLFGLSLDIFSFCARFYLFFPFVHSSCLG